MKMEVIRSLQVRGVRFWEEMEDGRRRNYNQVEVT